MARELGPQGEVEVMTRQQAEGLVRLGIFDKSGMDPVADQIFDPGVLGLVRRSGSLRLVTTRVRSLQEVQDAIRILVEDAMHSPDGADVLLQYVPPEESNFP